MAELFSEPASDELANHYLCNCRLYGRLRCLDIEVTKRRQPYHQSFGTIGEDLSTGKPTHRGKWLLLSQDLNSVVTAKPSPKPLDQSAF